MEPQEELVAQAESLSDYDDGFDVDALTSTAPSVGLESATKVFDDSAPDSDEGFNVDALVKPQQTIQQGQPGNPLQGFVSDVEKRVQPMRTMIQDMYQDAEWGYESETYAAEQIFQGAKYEDIEAHLGENKNAQLRAQKLDAITNAPGNWHLNLLRGAVGSVPFMMEMTKGRVAGGVAGATLGGGIGAGVGAIGAVATVEPLPIAAGGIAGAAYGWNIGGTLGMLGVATKVGVGKIYMKFRRLGATHEDALGLAAVGGPLIGMVNTSQFNLMEKVAKAAITGGLKQSEHLVFNALRTWFQTATLEGVQEAGEEAIPLVLQSFYAALRNKDVMPSWKDYFDGLTSAFAQGTSIGAVLGGGTQIGGHLTGLGLRKSMQMAADVALGPTATERKRAEENKKFWELAIEKTVAAKEKPADTPTERFINATDKLARAEEKRVAAVDKFKDLDKQIKNATSKDAGLLQARHDARMDVIQAQGAKRKAEFQLTVLKIEEEINRKSATEQQREAAQKEAQAAKNDYRRFKLSHAAKLVKTRRDQLEAQLEENIALIEQRTLAGKSTELLRKQSLKLSARIQDLDAFETVMNEGGLGDADIDELITQIPERRTADLLNNALKKIVETNRKTESAAKKDIGKYQGLLKKLVDKSPVENKEALKNRITKALDRESLEKISMELQASIEKIVEQQDRKKANAKLDAALAGFDPKTKANRPTSEMAGHRQGILDKFKEFINNPEKAQEVIAGYVDAEMDETNAKDANVDSENPTITEYDLTQDETYEIATKTYNFNRETSSIEEINALADEITLITEISKLQRAEEQKLIKDNALADRETVKDMLHGAKPVPREDIREEKQPTLIQEFFRNAGIKSSSFTAAMKMFGVDDRTQRKLEKVVDVATAVFEELRTNKMWKDRAMELMMQESGLKKAQLERFFADKKTYKALYKEGFVKSVDGADVLVTDTTTIDTTMAKLVDMRLNMLDSDLEAGMRADGYTYAGDPGTSGMSTQEVVDQLLGETGVKIATGLAKFYQEYGKESNALNVKERGLPLELNPNYSGRVMRKGHEDQQGTFSEFRSSLNERLGVSTKSTIPRKKNAKPIVRQDAWARVQRQIDEVEHWRHFGVSPAPGVGSIEYRLRTIWGDNSTNGTRDILRAKFGPDAPQNVDVIYMNAVGTRMKQYEMTDRIMNYLHSTMAKQMLFNNPHQLYKQATGMMMFFQHPKATVGGFLGGAVDYWSNKKKADAILDKNGFFLTAQDNNEIAMLKSFGGSGILSRMALKAQGISSWFLTSGIRWSSRTKAWALVKTLQADHGYTEEQAVQEAAEFTQETEGSTLPNQKFITESTTMGKLATAFTKPTRLAEQHALNTLRKMWSNPSKENIGLAVRSLAAAHITMGVFQAAASIPNVVGALMFEDDDDEKKRILQEEAIRVEAATLRGPWGGFVLGDIMNNGIALGLARMQKAEIKTYAPSAFYLASALNLYKLMEKGFKSLDEDHEPKDSDFLNYMYGILELGGLLPEPAGTFIRGAAAGTKAAAKQKEAQEEKQ